MGKYIDSHRVMMALLISVAFMGLEVELVILLNTPMID